ncbi:MAG TPA: cyclic lactone autoinducer peptide [Clostridia bacterium]|nr:cyclic lactone autoinducer peptide [Clostridia bacterium]
MKNWKYLFLSGIVVVLTFLANVNAASACSWLMYQPELPEALKK